jgi:DNA-binding SARP family transcriptional activator
MTVSSMIPSLTMLGPFALVIEGRDVRRLPRKAQALVALLALQQGRPMTREAIADTLWTRSGPEQARQSLRQIVLVLRRELGRDLVRIEADLMAIAVGRLSVDALEFQTCAASVERDDLARCAELYRGRSS